MAAPERSALTRLMLLSIAAAVATIALKTVAWQITDSVGLLSDALESIVNLVAALTALGLLRWASLPPDRRHMFGHDKAEYFSAGAEGALIVLAALAIAWAAVQRLIHPVELEDVGVGLAVSALASSINLAVGVTLLRAGRRHRSITVEADGRHLLTDVWTSAGVIVGVAAVALTGLRWLDPVIALAVAANILVTGIGLQRRAGAGLMDVALPEAEQRELDGVLDSYRGRGVAFEEVRSRQSGSRAFISMHVLVPGEWTVSQGHDLVDRLEADVVAALPEATVITHLEPAGEGGAG